VFSGSEYKKMNLFMYHNGIR